MRDIKFRAWDEANSEMVYSDKEDCFYINTKGAMFMYSHPKSVAGQITEYVKDYNVMQFTGLQDQNGVDIYEGDLIKNGSARICAVEFNEYQACFDAVVKKESSTGNALGFKCKDWSGVNGVRVIGNIHQHGDLLK